MKKKILACVIALGALLITPALAGNDKPIAVTQLPKAAQQFIKQHFPSGKVSLAKLDRELLEKSYEVVFADGVKVEFDRRGNWKDVDAKYGTVPASIVPKAILQHVQKNFPETTIKQIEKKRRGGYQVDLNNGIELIFDAKLNFVRYED